MTLIRHSSALAISSATAIGEADARSPLTCRPFRVGFRVWRSALLIMGRAPGVPVTLRRGSFLPPPAGH